jgi:hypothetical protein
MELKERNWDHVEAGRMVNTALGHNMDVKLN